MTLNIEKEPEAPRRVAKHAYMRETCAQMLERLAKAYDTSQTKVLEALLDTYGPALIRDAKKGVITE